MRFLSTKFRPRRMQQLSKLDVLRLLRKMPPHQLLMALGPNCLHRLPHCLVPPDPPSSSWLSVISGRIHKLVSVRVCVVSAHSYGKPVNFHTRAWNVLFPHVHRTRYRHTVSRTSFHCQHIFYVLVPTDHSLSQVGTTQRVERGILHRNVYLQAVFCAL